MHTPHFILPFLRLRARQATTLVELLVCLVVLSVAISMALPTITSGTRLTRVTSANLSEMEVAQTTLDLLHQRLTRSGRGLVVATPTLLVFRSSDDTRKRCTRVWLDAATAELRYATASAAATAADPLCPTGESPTTLARDITLRTGTPLFRFEDEPGVASPAGEEPVATRVIVGFNVAASDNDTPSYFQRALTVGR